MTATSPANETGRTRRLFVTVVIATAAAAVTAGVALKERHSGEAVVQNAEASPTLATGVAAPAQTRRAQWRDPWKRPAPLSESAPPSLHEPIDVSAPLADPSLPAAADALRGVSGATGEPTPTF